MLSLNKSSRAKKERHKKLLEIIKEDPFMTDEDIAEYLDVSVPTVRLDRLELGIPELRQRIREVASLNHQKVALHADEIIGEIIEINLGKAVFLFWIQPKIWYFHNPK